MRTPKPSKEQQLLFDLLKGDLPTSQEGVDTSILFDLFRRHRLFPIASPLLPLMDHDERERWKKAVRFGSMRTLGFLSRLQEIIDKLKEEGINAVPLKGPVLAYSLYGDVSQRHMRDLDLLIAPGDMLKALEVLKASGYMLKSPRKELTNKRWIAYFRYQYDVGLVHNHQGDLLELHTRIAYPGLLGGMEHLITENTETIAVSGYSVNSLSREGTFLYLAIHGVHHLFFRLFWLRDLAEAINRWDLDHTWILQTAYKMGAERMLGTGLRLAASYYGTPVPPEYHSLLGDQDHILSRMEKCCRKAIIEPQFYGWRSRLNVMRLSLLLKPGWRHKWESLSSVYHRWYIRKFLAR